MKTVFYLVLRSFMEPMETSLSSIIQKVSLKDQLFILLQMELLRRERMSVAYLMDQQLFI